MRKSWFTQNQFKRIANFAKRKFPKYDVLISTELLGNEDTLIKSGNKFIPVIRKEIIIREKRPQAGIFWPVFCKTYLIAGY